MSWTAAIVAIVLGVGGLTFASTLAIAARPHVFEKAFGEAGIGDGQFLEPSGVAVSQATGDVYVLDQGNDRVEWFSSTGEYEGQFNGSATPAKAFSFGFEALNGGIAIDNSCYFKKEGGGACAAADPSNGDVYITDSANGVVDKFSPTGTYLGQITEGEPGSPLGALDGVAVDASGEVWVYRESYDIDKYSNASANEFQQQWESPRGPLPGFAVDSEDNLFIRNGESTITKASPGAGLFTAEELIESLDEETSTGVAVDLSGEDGSTNDVYVDNVTSVAKFSTTGSQRTLLERFGSGNLSSGTGVAVSPASGDVYVADAANDAVDVFIPQPVPPSIAGTFTGTVTSSSADLQASINPNGQDTTYWFEYGTSTGYEHSTPVTDMGSGTTDQTVTQQVTGLRPTTTYHFRVVAHSATGTTTGHDDTFVYDTEPGGLPDGRVYEQVTPLQKAGAGAGADSATVAEDGTSLAGASKGAFAGLSNEELPPLGSAFYRFTRTPSGWTATPLSITRGQVQSIGVEDSLWSPDDLGSEVDHLSLREADGSISALGPVWQPALGPDPTETGGSYKVLGAAREASQGVIFTIDESSLLWPFDTTVKSNFPSLYDYVGVCGSQAECEKREPTLVGVAGGAQSTQLISQCGTTLGASTSVFRSSQYNAVSASGQTIFFTAEADSGSLSSASTAAWASSSTCTNGVQTGTAPPTNELYARSGGSQTVWVSEPQCMPTSACHNVTTEPYTTEEQSKAAQVIFEGASADGSKVFFTTTQQLVNGDTDTTRDLYEYDFNAPAGQRLIQVSGGGTGDATPGAGAEVEGVSRISEDGSHVYFVAHGVLTTTPSTDAQGYGEHREPVQTGAVPQAGADNLYVYDTGTKQTAFIADLCSGPEASGGLADAQCPGGLNSNPWSYGTGSHNDQALWAHGEKGGDERPVQATPDGRFLLFTSYGDLTADDTSTAPQVFRYDAQTGGLVRVSIGQDGFDNDGNTEAGAATIVTPKYDETGGSGGWTRGGALGCNMSDDGAYVFFQSPAGLTPQALNDVVIAKFTSTSGETITDYAQNVYEYHEGHVYLISDGQDASARGGGSSVVELIGTDASGADVFFTSDDPLVPQDTAAQEENVYDARIDGGFPISSAPSECQGETCQGGQSAPSVLGVPSSSTFFGAGNLAPPPSAPPKAKAKGLTRAQKLAKARHACRKKKNRKKRAVCEKQATRAYGATKKASKSTHRKRGK